MIVDIPCAGSSVYMQNDCGACVVWPDAQIWQTSTQRCTQSPTSTASDPFARKILPFWSSGVQRCLCTCTKSVYFMQLNTAGYHRTWWTCDAVQNLSWVGHLVAWYTSCISSRHTPLAVYLYASMHAHELPYTWLLVYIHTDYVVCKAWSDVQSLLNPRQPCTNHYQDSCRSHV